MVRGNRSASRNIGGVGALVAYGSPAFEMELAARMVCRMQCVGCTVWLMGLHALELFSSILGELAGRFVVSGSERRILAKLKKDWNKEAAREERGMEIE